MLNCTNYYQSELKELKVNQVNKIVHFLEKQKGGYVDKSGIRQFHDYHYGFTRDKGWKAYPVRYPFCVPCVSRL